MAEAIDPVASVPAKRVSRWRHRLIGAALALAGLALCWTLVIGWWLPRFLQPRIEAAATEALGAPLRLGRLEIAPWSLVASAADVVLGPAEAPWFKLEALRAEVSTESIWRLAPVLNRLSLQAPQLSIERLDNGRFNFTPLLEALARRPPAPAGEGPAKFSAYNIRVIDGRVHVVDRMAQTEHHVESLQIGVPFISTLPSHHTIDVEPLLDARVNGSRLQLHGKTQPFGAGRRATVNVDWQAIDVARWLQAVTPLLPTPLPAVVSRGELALALQVAFDQPAAQPPALRITGKASLTGLSATLPAHDAALDWKTLSVEGLDLLPLQRRVAIATLRLDAPQARIDTTRLLTGGGTASGGVPVADKSPQSPQSPPMQTAAPGAKTPQLTAAASAARHADDAAWQWRIDQAQLDSGSVRLAHRAWPDDRTLGALTLTAQPLDSRSDAPPAELRASVQDAAGGRLQLQAALQVASRRAEMSASAAGLDVAAWLAPWHAALPVRVLGAMLDASAKVEVAPDRWAVREGSATLSAVKLQPLASTAAAPPAPRASRAPRAPRTPLPTDQLDIARVTLGGLEASPSAAGASVSVRARSLVIDTLDLKALRTKSGALAWVGPAAARDPASAGGAPVRWQLDELSCRGCAFALRDEAVDPSAALALQRTDITLRGLSDEPARPIGLEVSTQSRAGGRVRLRGSVVPVPLALRSRVDVAALDLRMLQPYLQPHFNLELVSARLDAAGDLRLDGPGASAAQAKPGDAAAPRLASVQWKGALGLAELRTIDVLNQAELVRFKSLRIDGSQLAWRHDAAVRADLGDVTLQDFYGRVIVNADGRLNLLDIARRDGQQAGQSLTTPRDGQASQAAPPLAPDAVPAAPSPPDAAVAAASAAEQAAGRDATRPQVRWRAIAIEGGAVDFTDNFIRPNYSAKLTDLTGKVGPLAWDDPQAAAVTVAGKVDGSAPLEITGSMHPLGARLATDITASARGIDITRLTGYSARYAGYGIEKGTLSVKVRYRIAAGQLQADNNLYIDQLTFGDKVESPSAMKLPVQLAVSLLKDRNGVIDLDLPISGSLDDPQFSVGGLIVKVIVNLITKAVTAPFSLLANALGGSGGPALSHVDFAPGSADLTDGSRQALDALAKALDDRPALRLEATGHADAAQDDIALRRQHVEQLIRSAKARVTGDLPESIGIPPGERERWLTAAYKAADLKTKPRNAIGLAKDLPGPEMEALLMASAPGGDAALLRLADERGNRVKAYLVTRLPPERVLLTASKLGPSSAAPVAAPLPAQTGEGKGAAPSPVPASAASVATAGGQGAPATGRGPRVEFALK